MNKKTTAFLFCVVFFALIAAGCSQKPATPAADTTVPDTTTVVEEAWVKLDKSVYGPDEIITVEYMALEEFDDNAWIGLIPSEVPHGDEEENDEYDLQYHLIGSDLSGEITFIAPTEPGLYDIRMFTSDFEGVEVTYQTFEVLEEGVYDYSAVSAYIDLEKAEFEPGEEIEVSFTVSEKLSPSAWLGLIPSEIEHGDEEECDKYDLDYEYLEEKLEGSFVFYAPDEPGSYDFRLFDSDDGGKEITYTTFTVAE
ncbi:hypothetical protein JW890_05845 [candidate division WOR-3 bacterium]|nr:hypothetical protein [candidate division WOR-3 bacterium]